MGHRNVEIPCSDVGSSEAALTLDSCIPTPDLLAAILVINTSAQGPHSSSADAATPPQSTIAAEEPLRLLSGQIESAPFAQPADIRKKPESSTLKNPADIVWRSLMLDP